MKERFARGIERDELAARTTLGGAHFTDVASTTDCRDAVTRAATRAVECGSQPFIRGLDFEEVVETDSKGFEFHRRYAS
jgi:hypothetical protein